MEGDGNLLQHLQKRATRTSCSYPGSHLSPLGSGSHADKLRQLADNPGPSFVADPDAGTHSCTLPIFQPGIGTASAYRPEYPPAAGIAVVPPGISTSAAGSSSSSSNQAPLLSLQDVGICVGRPSNAPAPSEAASSSAWQGVQMQEKQPLVGAATEFLPCISLPAAAGSAGPSSCGDQAREDDDLPLADMVKQCLSGNSFLYSSCNGGTTLGRPSLIPVSRNASGIASSSSNSRSAQSNSRSAQGNSQAHSSEGAAMQEQDSGQHTDQAADKMLAEQQEAMRKFNTLRKTLGIKPRCLAQHNAIGCNACW
jgi:hypothetical protein